MDVIAVATDLMSQSRIRATARSTGHQVRFISTPDELVAFPVTGLALVDLEAAVEVEAMIRLLKRHGLHVVAFGPHLETDRLKAARAAGADRVLARSKFVTELPRILGAQGAGDSVAP